LADVNLNSYSNDENFKKIELLISEKKYNLAKKSLNDLIQNSYETAYSYELLGDIYLSCDRNFDKALDFYLLSYNSVNYSSDIFYKIAKIYLIKKDNVNALNYLKKTVEVSNSRSQLEKISEILLYNFQSQSKFDENMMYELLGNIYIKLGKKQEAYSAFNKAMHANPSDVYLKYYIGNLFFNDDKNYAALTVYNSILNDFPNDSQIKLMKAETYLKDGNLLYANKEYLAVLKENPNSIQAQYGIYKIYDKKLTPDKILMKINANNTNYKPTKASYYNLANLLKSLNDIEASERILKYIDKIYPKENKQITNIDLKNQKENTQQKIQKTNTVSNVDLKKQNNLNNISKNISDNKNQKKSVNNASNKNATSVKLLQNNNSLKNKTVVSKENEKKSQIKKIENEKVLKEKKEKEEKEALANKLENEKKLKEKKEKEEKDYIDKMIIQEEKNAVNKNPKKYKEYKQQIDKYLNASPKTEQNYIAAANTYKIIPMHYAALKYYKEAMKLNPTNSDIYYDIGLTYLELNQLEKSKLNLEKSVNLDKDNQKAINLLAFVNQKIVTGIINNAYAKFEKTQYVDAMLILDDGVKRFNKNAQIYYYRALVYDAMNRNAASILDLQKTIEFDPAYYMAYYQLGKMYEKIHDEKNALISYERFLSTEPDEKDLVEEVQKKVINLGKKYY